MDAKSENEVVKNCKDPGCKESVRCRQKQYSVT